MILAVRQNLIASLTILSSVDFIIFSVLIMLQCETELHPFYLFCHCKYISAEVDGGVILPQIPLSVSFLLADYGGGSERCRSMS